MKKKLFIVVAMIMSTASTSYVLGQAANKSFWACQGGIEMINPNSTEYVAIFEGSSNYEAVKDSYREQFCAYLKQNKVAEEMIARHRTGPACQCTQMQDVAMSKWFLPQLHRQYPTIPYEEIVWFPGHD